ncbi:MAG: acyltransferase [Verrucomicrobiota bacterium]
MIHRIISGIVSRLRNLYWKSRGVRIRGYCRLGRIDIPREHRALEFEKDVALEDGCSFIISSVEGRSPPRLKVGANSYFNRGVILDACELLTIGQSVMIGPNSYITDHDHALKGDRSDLISQPTCIEDAVWIGANVCILKGVTVGAGSVIGAGSVVTKSVPPNCLAVGNPAKVVREL